jgi:hypothetical protein
MTPKPQNGFGVFFSCHNHPLPQQAGCPTHPTVVRHSDPELVEGEEPPHLSLPLHLFLPLLSIHPPTNRHFERSRPRPTHPAVRVILSAAKNPRICFCRCICLCRCIGFCRCSPSTHPQTVISTEAVHAFVSSKWRNLLLNFTHPQRQPFPPGCPMFATASSSLTRAPFCPEQCRRARAEPEGPSDRLLPLLLPLNLFSRFQPKLCCRATTLAYQCFSLSQSEA